MAAPKAVWIELSKAERTELEARLRRRKVARGDALRAEIVLLAPAGMSNSAITERLGAARATVALWRGRFAAKRLDGLHDEPRPGAPRTVADEKVAEVVTTTLEKLPAGRTHWSSRGMAKAAGLAPSTVQRIWKAFSLQPHRVETFKLSTGPLFVDKVRDIVGLYLSPPERALVLCVDEKSQIQALDRTQPLLPLRPGQAARRTHDYKRHGTTSMFAALDVKAGTVIGQWMPRHRAAEFRRFLDTVEASVPDQRDIHVVMDNVSSHKTKLIRDWFAKRPRWHVHYGICASLLHRWRRAARGEVASRRAAAPVTESKLVATGGTASSIEVLLRNGRVLRIGPATDVAAVVRLASALEA
jgi:transposase